MSPEELVLQAYRGILGREADPGGLNHYCSALAKGTPLSEVLKTLIDSEESINRLRLPTRKTAARKTRAVKLVYAQAPVHPPNFADCQFYHTMDLPTVGLVHGQWDLRSGIDDYLANFDFRGKSVLEIGPASGFVSFEMEKRGGRIVALDLDDRAYDAPPFPDTYLKLQDYAYGLRSIRNGFWLAHHLNKSHVRVAYGHANELPQTIGPFDVGVMGNVLQHLENPMGAMLRLASVCRTIIVTEADWYDGQFTDVPAMIYFNKDNPYSWFQVKPPLVTAFLRRMGFVSFQLSRHFQTFVEDVEHTATGPLASARGTSIPHFTIVAHKAS